MACMQIGAFEVIAKFILLNTLNPLLPSSFDSPDLDNEKSGIFCTPFCI